MEIWIQLTLFRGVEPLSFPQRCRGLSGRIWKKAVAFSRLCVRLGE